MTSAYATEEELFEALFESAPDSTLIVDARGVIVRANRRLEVQFGYRPAELLGRSVEVLIPQRMRRGHSMLRAQYAEDPAERQMDTEVEIFALHRDGREIPVEIYLCPLKVPGEQLIAASLRDITRARGLREEADRIRDELIATVSHELRTPLTSVLGYAELLRDMAADDLDAQAVRLLDAIERNAHRELRLVNDLLSFSQTAPDRLRVRLAPTDLAAVARQVVEDHTPLASEAGLELVSEIDELPAVLGDPLRLAQVAENLLTNAAKFTPAGGRVTLRVRELDGVPTLEVCDTGSGIAAADHDRIFERLYRAPEAVSAQKPGAGLGLAIVQVLVQRHGGRVEVDSAPGMGTTFRVRLRYTGTEA